MRAGAGGRTRRAERAELFEGVGGEVGDPEDLAGAAAGVGAAEGGIPAVAVGAGDSDEVAGERDKVVAIDGEQAFADGFVGGQAMGVGGVMRNLIGREGRIIFPPILVPTSGLADGEVVDDGGGGHGAPAEGEVDGGKFGAWVVAVTLTSEDNGGDGVTGERSDRVVAVDKRRRGGVGCLDRILRGGDSAPGGGCVAEEKPAGGGEQEENEEFFHDGGDRREMVVGDGGGGEGPK